MNVSIKFQSDYTERTLSDEIHQNIDDVTPKNSSNIVPVFLVGMMGAGKSTIGRSLAQHMNRKFVDLDSEIELSCRVSIPVIFEIEGESGFRKRESELLQKFSNYKKIVMATGGGAILHQNNRSLLKNRGIVVYLRAELDVLFKRTINDTNRPLLADQDPYSKLRNLLELREPMYYEIADVVIDTGNHSVNDIAKKIALILQTHEKLI